MTMLLPLMLTVSTALASEAAVEVTFEPTLVEAVAPDLGAMELPYASQDAAAVRASRQESEALLERYQLHARTAIRGEILTTRKAGPEGAEYTIVTMEVSDTYRGRKVTRVEEFYVDRGLGDAPGRIQPELVTGYTVLVFLDRSGWLMDGDAMFTVEARHAFRKRSARVFSRPSADRDWDALTDPSASWTMLDLDAVEAAMAERRGRWDS